MDSKLIYAKTKVAFETAFDATARAAGGSAYSAVAFIENGYLFTHGKYFRMFPDAASIFTSVTTNGIATVSDANATALGTIDVGVTSVLGGNLLTNSALVNGVITIDHDTSGVTANSYGPTADKSDVIAVPRYTVDAYGHLTASSSYNATLNQVLGNVASSTFYLLGHTSSAASTGTAVKISSIYGDASGNLTASKFIGTLNKKIDITLNGFTVTFNNTADVAASFYAPTSAGTSGQILQANSSGVPVWVSLSGVSSGSTATEIPSAQAVYNAINSGIASNDAMIFKGVIDASTNPNYPAGSRGDTYKISVAGKVGGASGVVVEAGDTIICTEDAVATGDQATVGVKWNILQTNIVGAVTSGAALPAGTVLYGAGGQAIVSLANSTAGYLLTCGGGTTAPTWSAPQAFAVQVNGTAFGSNYTPTVAKTVNFKAGSNVTLGTSGSDITINSSYVNYYPTAFAWTDGTTGGPTGSLTVSGTTAVSFGAIPTASGTVSGIVTTGAQTFAGAKTFSGGISGTLTGTASLANDLTGGAAGSIPYQTGAGATAFLAGSTVNGYVLKYNTATNVPYWAVDIDTDTHWTSKNIVGASGTATANAAAANGSVYLNHTDNGAVTSAHKIIGVGATAVTSDASGNISITSSNT